MCEHECIYVCIYVPTQDSYDIVSETEPSSSHRGGPIEGGTGDGISLIPLGGEVQDITTQDLQYPLKNEDLQLGPAKGVSNVISGSDPRVEFGTGNLLIVHTPTDSEQAIG